VVSAWGAKPWEAVAALVLVLLEFFANLKNEIRFIWQ
jgi:hypothetical protein